MEVDPGVTNSISTTLGVEYPMRNNFLTRLLHYGWEVSQPLFNLQDRRKTCDGDAMFMWPGGNRLKLTRPTKSLSNSMCVYCLTHHTRSSYHCVLALA